jgi:peroxiredoxin
MKPIKNVISILFAGFVLATFAFTTPAYANLKHGQPAPGFKVITTSGQSVTLDNYRGHVLVVDFFATWCQPCRQSIPHLVEMNRKYGKQGLHILGLSADEDGERVVRTFATENKINYPLALAGDATTVDFGIRSVPVMFLIDKKGKIAEIYRGFSDEIGRSIEQNIKRLLSEK